MDMFKYKLDRRVHMIAVEKKTKKTIMPVNSDQTQAHTQQHDMLI